MSKSLTRPGSAHHPLLAPASGGSCSRPRWLAKNASRFVVSRVHALLGSGAPTDAPHVRVLCYHRIRDAARDPFSVSPAVFDRQMRWLAAQRRAIGVADLADHLAGCASIVDGSVLVTIDDGFEDTWTRAAPSLERHRIPAIAFVPAATVGKTQGGRHLSRAQLRELQSAGVTVGSHAVDHLPLTRLDASAALRQIVESRRILEDALGRSVTTFAYPFGTRASFDAQTEAMIRSAGYSMAFTALHGAVRATSSRWRIPRVKIEGGDSMQTFQLIVDGGLDWWRLIDRYGARLQAVPGGGPE